MFFFFNDTATTEIYTLSLHAALPISCTWRTSTSAPAWGERVGRSCSRPSSRSFTSEGCPPGATGRGAWWSNTRAASTRDRKSTRLNSSHSQISYAVFCLKKKIITCYGLEQLDSGALFLVLQMINKPMHKDNASLRSWVRPGELPTVEEALTFVVHVALGM